MVIKLEFDSTYLEFSPEGFMQWVVVDENKRFSIVFYGQDTVGIPKVASKVFIDGKEAEFNEVLATVMMEVGQNNKRKL